ncbi:DHA2 family efflux MFS transporter permease subunit [Luteococcus sp. Sow4_B9]|uniref:DHA2 family efflux MFS transporter permease subunit n=1 Tax=Luteococcus sp. Sow4_B9 TaxID=3438792 RepID=UPI003F998AA6
MPKTDTSPALDAAAPQPMTRDAKVVVAVLVFGAFVMMLNETTLGVALPAMMADFHVSANTAQWLLTGFMLTMAVLMPAMGWLIDRFPTRTNFTVALGFFLVGTITAALAPTFPVMLVARVAQAVGTTIMMPLIMTVVLTVVPVHIRGTVMGLIAVVMAVGPALGPSVAGAILAFSTWHAIFWVMVPLVALAGVVGLFFMRNVGTVRRAPFDAVSVALSAAAFGGLIYAISSIGAIVDRGPGASRALVLLVVGFVALLVFGWRQVRLGRTDEALLDLRPFLVRNFSVSITVLLLVHAALLGALNVLPLYLQQSLLTTALVSGLAVLPGGLLEGLLSPVFGRFYDRIGPRRLVIPGAFIVAVTLLLLGTVDDQSLVWFVVAVHLVFSIGLAMLYTPLMTTGLGSLPEDLYSHGSAILNTLQQLAAAIGTAFMIATYSGVAAGRMRAGLPEQTALGQGAAVAFLVTGVVAVLAAVLSFFVRPAPVRSITQEP